MKQLTKIADKTFAAKQSAQDGVLRKSKDGERERETSRSPQKKGRAGSDDMQEDEDAVVDPEAHVVWGHTNAGDLEDDVMDGVIDDPLDEDELMRYRLKELEEASPSKVKLNNINIDTEKAQEIATQTSPK